MVDIILHNQFFPPIAPAEGECIPLSSLSQTEEPFSGFFLLLPSTVMGFSMQTKRWGKALHKLFLLYTANKTF